MNAETFLKWLEDHDACTEAREWVAGKTLEEAWNTCPKGTWMLWLAGTVSYDLERRILVAWRCQPHDLPVTLVDFIRERVTVAQLLAAMTKGV